MSDLNASHCLADLFCIPALEPPCYGSARHIHTAVTVVDIPRYPLFPFLFPPLFYSQISLTLPPSVFAVAAFDLGPVVSHSHKFYIFL